MGTLNKDYLPAKGAEFGLNFHLLISNPIDTRFIRRTYQDIKNAESWNEGTAQSPVYYVYKGMAVVAQDTGNIYVYKGRVDTVAHMTTDLASDASWVRAATASEIAGSGATKYMGVTNAHLSITGAQVGDTYFDSTDKKFFVWNGTSWDDVTVSDNTHATSADTADEADSLSSDININGLSVNGGSTLTNLIVCSTAAGIQEKELTLPESITVDAGTQLKVRFTYGNTHEAPKIKYSAAEGTNLLCGSTNMGYIEPGAILDLTFDGTYWQASITSGSYLISSLFSKKDATRILKENDIVDDYKSVVIGTSGGSNSINASSLTSDQINKMKSIIEAIYSLKDDYDLKFLKHTHRYKFELAETPTDEIHINDTPNNKRTVKVDFVKGGKFYKCTLSYVFVEATGVPVSFDYGEYITTPVSRAELNNYSTSAEVTQAINTAIESVNATMKWHSLE